MKRVFLIAAGATIAVGAAPLQAHGGVTGRWLTDDRSGVVEVAPCGTAMCGRLVSVLDPKAPARDVNNPDPKLRQRPLLGIAVLSGLTHEGASWSGGHAYDPKAGRSYRAEIRPAADGGLDVTGCLFVICRTRHWTRATGEDRR